MPSPVNMMQARRQKVVEKFVDLYEQSDMEAAHYLASLDIPEEELVAEYRPLIRKEFTSRGWELPDIEDAENE